MTIPFSTFLDIFHLIALYDIIGLTTSEGGVRVNCRLNVHLMNCDICIYCVLISK